MKNFIVIPVHNQLDHLKKCISSIELNTTNYEIVIVDDGSDPITKEWIYSHKNSYKIINSEAGGFSKACNSGINFIKENFDYNLICLLNSDTEIINYDWLELISKEIRNIKNPGVGSVVSNNAGHQTVDDPNKYKIDIHTKKTYEYTLPHGFCYIMTKNAVDKIGLLDEVEFPHYGSEDDYSIKCVKAGMFNFLVSKVLVLHHASASYTKERRSSLLQTTVPALMNKWDRTYVSSLIRNMSSICSIINK